VLVEEVDADAQQAGCFVLGDRKWRELELAAGGFTGSAACNASMKRNGSSAVSSASRPAGTELDAELDTYFRLVLIMGG
jgi:hypothetical protein